MELTDIYYFHSYLNWKLFKGKLEPVIIELFDFGDDKNLDNIEARIETDLDPFIIFMGNHLLKEDPISMITVLLHEMVHQYNRQRGYEDTEEWTGKHLAIFRRAAAAHGLEMGGYRLTAEMKEMIEEHLKAYERVKELRMRFF